MMTSPTPLLRLKNPKGWFAAGSQIQEALVLLSDGAFKLFVYVCLNARRDTGTLDTSQRELAGKLHKSTGSVRRYLRELQDGGVCRFQMTQNPHAKGVIEITEQYWPYDRGPGESAHEDESDYIARVKKLLLVRACVRSSFSVADERLAREWFEQGIPLERVEHAILLGCARKYVSWRNGNNTSPIASLRYFESTLEEVSSQVVAQEYWEYVRLRLERMEKLWLDEHRSLKPANPTNTERSLPTDGPLRGMP